MKQDVEMDTGGQVAVTASHILICVLLDCLSSSGLLFLLNLFFDFTAACRISSSTRYQLMLPVVEVQESSSLTGNAHFRLPSLGRF